MGAIGCGVVDAVDQSDLAWQKAGSRSLPGVTFHHQTADQFLAGPIEKPYDAINVAFGMKQDEADGIARRALAKGGLMLAPVTTSDTVLPPGKVHTRHHLISKSLTGALRDQALNDRVLNHDWYFQPDVTAFPPASD